MRSVLISKQAQPIRISGGHDVRELDPHTPENEKRGPEGPRFSTALTVSGR